MERRFALPCVATHALVLQEHELVVVRDSERIAVVGFDGVVRVLKAVRAVSHLVLLRDPVRLVTVRHLPANAEEHPRALEGLPLPQVAIETRSLDDLEVTASLETTLEVLCASGPALFVGAAGRLARFELGDFGVRETWSTTLWTEPTPPVDRLLALDVALAEAEEAVMETVGDDDSFPDDPRGPAGARFRDAERAIERARDSFLAERAKQPTFHALAWSEDDGRLLAITDRSVLRVLPEDSTVETIGSGGASTLVSGGALFALDFAAEAPAWISLNDGVRHAAPLGKARWRSLCLHPLERRVAIVEGTGVRIVDLITGSSGATFAPFRDDLALAAFSADGSILFLASRGGAPAGLITDSVTSLTTPVVQVMRAGAAIIRLDAAGTARWSTHQVDGVRELLCGGARVALLRNDEVMVIDVVTAQFPAVRAHLNGEWLGLLSRTAGALSLERVNLNSLAIERVPCPQLTERAFVCISHAGTVIALERRGAGVRWAAKEAPQPFKLARPVPVSASPRFSKERLVVPRTLDVELDGAPLPRTHTESISAFSVSPSGTRAASASSAEVVVWDLERLMPIAEFTVEARVSSLAIADDGVVDLVDDLRGHTVLDPERKNAGAAL